METLLAEGAPTITLATTVTVLKESMSTLMVIATMTTVHNAGMRCLSYTVNDEWAAERLLALGTDAIITDRVDLFSASR